MLADLAHRRPANQERRRPESAKPAEKRSVGRSRNFAGTLTNRSQGRRIPQERKPTESGWSWVTGRRDGSPGPIVQLRSGAGRCELLRKLRGIVLGRWPLGSVRAHHARGRGLEALVGPRRWSFDKLRTGFSLTPGFAPDHGPEGNGMPGPRTGPCLAGRGGDTCAATSPSCHYQ
jgi:hypothetical protein